MRQIEKDTIRAINKGESWDKSNMTVNFNGTDFKVFLFGNAIAKYENKQFYVSWAGWITNTTRNRLNILSNERFNIKQGEPYHDGESCPRDEWIKVEPSLYLNIHD